MVLEWPDYVAAFLVSAVLSWALTPALLRLAIRRGIFDEPGARKAQASPVPYLGGLAIVAGFSLAVLGAALIGEPGNGADELALLLALALGLSIMGLVDDLRGLPASLRLAVEIGAGFAVWAGGSGAQLPGPAWLDAVVTVLWVVIITNAFNLLDNMDGLSAGVATIAAFGFFAVAVSQGQYLVAALSAGLAGCALGFLRHNFHPARIYMGDAGSLYLGFLLAVVGVRLRLDGSPQVVALFVPVVILGVALLDTTLVVIARLRHGISPLTGGRDHVSHRLVWVGIPVPVAVGLIYGAGAGLAWVGLVLARIDDVTTGLMLVALVAVTGAATAALLYAVPVYANSRQRRAMLQVVQVHHTEPERLEPDAPRTALGPTA